MRHATNPRTRRRPQLFLLLLLMARLQRLQRRRTCPRPPYKIRHFFVFFSFRVSRAALVACSKTSRTPSFVFAEHSRYFWAPIFLRTSSACCVLVRLGWSRVACTDLLRAHWLLRRLVQLLNRLLVEAQILLATDEDDGQALAEVQHFGDPLCRVSARSRVTEPRGLPSPGRCRANRASRRRSR
jgi:hypothetical protein